MKMVQDADESGYEARIAESADPIQAWRTLPVPSRLWHYTSVGGFYGILTSACLHATDFRFLNDSEESVHAQRFIEAEVLPTLHENAPNEFKSALSTFRFPYLTFITSFSRERDRLSQWRGYSHDSIGISIGFDLTSLKVEEDSYQTVALRRCVYDASAKRALLLGIIQPLVQFEEEFNRARAEFFKNQALLAREGKPWLLDPQGRSGRGISMRLGNELSRYGMRCGEVVPFLKNAAFKEEGEWRLSYCSASSSLPGIPAKFKPAIDSVVPYFELKEPLTTVALTPLIREVIPGPGAPEHTLSSTEALLKNCGVSAEVSKSRIPFRNK